MPPDHGMFGPDSVAWHINRELAVLLASGARALMLQVAHPKVAAAVADHSRYRTDPVGRLRDTLDAIYAFTFAPAPAVERVVAHIHDLHTRVHGQTPEGHAYSALDPHLLLWVYATLMDSSLLAYETFVAPLAPAEREAYYVEFCRSAPIWGIRRGDLPATLTELRAWMADLVASGEVRVTPQGRYVGHFILEPQVWWLPPHAAFPLRLVTLWLLPPALREGFGYSWGPSRERLLQTTARFSRTVVPRLPHAMRDLPIARRAMRRVARHASP